MARERFLNREELPSESMIRERIGKEVLPVWEDVRNYLKERISNDTVIIGDIEEMGKELAGRGQMFFDVPLLHFAKELGSPLFANVVAAGIITALFDVDISLLEQYFDDRFGAKDKDLVTKNIDAAKKGYEIARELAEDITVKMDHNSEIGKELLLTGSDAVALGAIAGGCNMIFGYPMSPATGVLSHLSQVAEEFGIVTEQTEDEISAMNMAIGGWYAGGRAMVTTSGGGFDLMSEGLSLVGIGESPMVIHLGQRPGPATGLATRPRTMGPEPVQAVIRPPGRFSISTNQGVSSGTTIIAGF